MVDDSANAHGDTGWALAGQDLVEGQVLGHGVAAGKLEVERFEWLVLQTANGKFQHIVIYIYWHPTLLLNGAFT
jgi:hypothetical protein